METLQAGKRDSEENSEGRGSTCLFPQKPSTLTPSSFHQVEEKPFSSEEKLQREKQLKQEYSAPVGRVSTVSPRWLPLGRHAGAACRADGENPRQSCGPGIPGVMEGFQLLHWRSPDPDNELCEPKLKQQP